MTTLDKNKRDWLDDRIEAFLDGDLSPEEAAAFDEVALMDENLAREMKISQSISTSLGMTADLECPDEVVRNVMAHVKRDVRRSYVQRLMDGILDLPILRPKPAFAMALLVIVVLSSTLISRRTTGTDPEVTQALADVKLALAYLSDVGRTTGTTVGQDVIGPHVVGPMSKSLNSIIEN